MEIHILLFKIHIMSWNTHSKLQEYTYWHGIHIRNDYTHNRYNVHSYYRNIKKEGAYMLLKDEQYVIKWLSQYGALPKTQIIKMLQKPEDTAEKIIKNLKKQMQIEDVGGGYYIGLDSMCTPDQKLILAVWVLIKFIDKVDPMAHYPAVYPSQLFFLKENMGYEIVVLYEGEQSQLRLLQPEEDLKYIIVIPHRSMIDKLKLPKADCLFATVDYTGNEEPEVVFYENKENKDEVRGSFKEDRDSA